VIAAAGVPVTAYQSVREAMAGEQLRHRGTLVAVQDAAGEYRVPNLPFRLSEAIVEVGRRVPALGEHGEQVLAELAGLSGDSLHAVVAAGRRRTA
jgi:CoA:oxalate CoA-transferase